MFACKLDNPHVPSMVNVYRNGEHFGTGEVLDDGTYRLPLVDRNGNLLNKQFYSLAQYLKYANRYAGLTKQAARDYLGV